MASGLRHDLILADRRAGEDFLLHLLKYHVSGQLKIAPEHSEDDVLALMGKPSIKSLQEFIVMFRRLNRKICKNQFLTYYFIAAHPGCSQEHMNKLKRFCQKTLHLMPEQVQIFTPAPSTYSTLMFFTGFNPFNLKEIIVEREMGKMEKQKKMIAGERNHF